ncbi:MAG TPA: hypothetical protein VIC57_09720 [Candidatus Dormibacteraeota bacterium]|jgi:hypothetical protein
MPVVILFVIGMVAWMGGAASWIVLGLLTWAAIWLVFGGSRRRRRRRMRHHRSRWAQQMDEQPPAPIPPPVPVQPQIAPPPQPVVNLNQLPADVEKKVDRIRRKAAVLGRHPDRFPIGSKDLYVVQHTASDYLPSTVNAYLEVPSWSVNTPVADGRTPLDMLNNQLELLETKLDEIAEQVRKQRVDNLLANERFLEENFGGREPEELTIPR